MSIGFEALNTIKRGINKNFNQKKFVKELSTYYNPKKDQYNTNIGKWKDYTKNGNKKY